MVAHGFLDINSYFIHDCEVLGVGGCALRRGRVTVRDPSLDQSPGPLEAWTAGAFCCSSFLQIMAHVVQSLDQPSNYKDSQSRVDRNRQNDLLAKSTTLYVCYPKTELRSYSILTPSLADR